MPMPHKIFISYYNSPVGELILGDYGGQLVLCDWRYRRMRQSVDTCIKKGLKAEYCEERTALHTETERQLSQYFKGDQQTFSIPLNPIGSPFQQQVWVQLCQIPYGQTNTYMQLADRLGDRSAIRAVASANGANALSIFIPCHRVIGSDGKLVGYAGGVAAKQRLLLLEKGISGVGQTELFPGEAIKN